MKALLVLQGEVGFLKGGGGWEKISKEFFGIYLTSFLDKKIANFT